jgi:hypothetical protein
LRIGDVLNLENVSSNVKIKDGSNSSGQKTNVQNNALLQHFQSATKERLYV